VRKYRLEDVSDDYDMSIHLTFATSDDPCHHTSGDNCCMLPAVPMG